VPGPVNSGFFWGDSCGLCCLDVEEFKILYHKRFGEQVSDQEAMVMAEKLLDLFRAVYRKNMQLV